MIRSFIFVFVQLKQMMLLILPCMMFGIILFMTGCSQAGCIAFEIARICELALNFSRYETLGCFHDLTFDL